MKKTLTEKVSIANGFINDYLDNNGFCLTWYNLTDSGYIFFKSRDLAEAHTYYSKFENLPEHQPDYIAKLTDQPGRNEIFCEVSIWDCTLINENDYNKVINYVNDDNVAPATELLTEMQFNYGNRLADKESYLEKDEATGYYKLTFNCWRIEDEIPNEETTPGLRDYVRADKLGVYVGDFVRPEKKKEVVGSIRAAIEVPLPQWAGLE